MKVISYLTLRRCIGILAMLFPVLLIVSGGFPMQESLSAYYWTTAGDLFVGFLVTIGIFLLSYRGHDLQDDIISGTAGAAYLCVALFPCEGSPVPDYLFMFLSVKATAIIHYITAVIAFGAMGTMSLFQFTKGLSAENPQKVKRNRVYRTCGYIIYASLVVGAILQFIPGARAATDIVRLWYWLESVMVWAFGVSWLVKGETLWRDK